jgi:lysophospholipase L1-like esterase
MAREGPWRFADNRARRALRGVLERIWVGRDVTGARRFVVTAASRQPRIGVDYQPTAVPPTYMPTYLNPPAYRIFVDAFPGVWLEPKGDQQASPHGPKPRDIWHLQVPDGTTGFEFTLSGHPERRLTGGPPPREVSITARTKLPATTGTFSEHDPAGPWTHTFSVPGPGSYRVSVSTVSPAGAGPVQSTTIVLRDILVVSIGDSAASGEGNPDKPGRPKGFDPDLGWWDLIPIVGAYTLASGLLDALRNVVKKKLTTLNRALGFTMEMDPEPVWLEPRAHRSLRSGHAIAARMVEKARPGTVVTFLPFGRSGATIETGLIGAGRGPEDNFVFNLSEIDEIARTIGKRRIEALLIYIGINDIGITDVLTNLTQGDISWIPFVGGDDGAHRATAHTNATHVIDHQFPGKFKKLADEIKERLNVRHVYLCEYPSGLFDDQFATPKAGCGLFSSDFDMDISPADARTIQAINNELNDGLSQAVKDINNRPNDGLSQGADDNKWFYVTNIANRFRGKGYCTDVWVDRAFNQAEESLGFQGDTEGTVHPNGRGHQIIAEEVAAMLLKHTVDDPVTTTPGVHDVGIRRVP